MWIRVFSRIPLALWHLFARFVAFLAWRVIPYRRQVVEGNLRKSFPDWDGETLERAIRDFYRGFADVFVEVVHSLRMTPAELARRVTLKNSEPLRDEYARGKPVMVLASHQCNWEWLLLGLSQLGVPVDAAYKPLMDRWAESEMRKLRSVFGARMIPAQELLGDIIRQRGKPRTIAILADQEPKKGERMHWVRFLNRDSAFYIGPEEIARTTRCAAYFANLRRTSRGHYEVEFARIADAGEKLPTGEFTERYARLVEQQIHAAPPDWPWSYKRWKQKKPLYG
jgi:KDO2-lipid IV(A) lauroyltransferase